MGIRNAIAYHFFHDIETAPAVHKALRSVYDGSLTLAKYLVVWNITPDEITTRGVVINPDTWPTEWDKAKPNFRAYLAAVHPQIGLNFGRQGDLAWD